MKFKNKPEIFKLSNEKKFKPDVIIKIAKCYHNGACEQEKMFLFSSSTTAMLNHLKADHNTAEATLVQAATDQRMIQAHITAYLKPLKLLGKDEVRYKVLAHYWTLAFVALNWPPYWLRSKLLRTAVEQTSDGQFTLPSINAFINHHVPVEYKVVREEVMEGIINAPSVSLNVDTCSKYSHTYLTVMCSAITPEFELKSYCLATKEVDGTSALDTAENINAVITDFGLNKQQISALTTDNAQALLNTAGLLEGPQSIRCICHLLQLCIRKALQAPNVANLLTKCRQIVALFKRSTKNANKLRRLQRKNGVKILQVIQHNATRWNTDLFVLMRLEELAPILDQALFDIKQRGLMLTDVEWTLLKLLVAFLKPYYVATETLSASSYPTLNLVRPLLVGLQNKCKEVIARNDQIKDVSTVMQKDLLTRTAHISKHDSIYTIATFLDPRFCDMQFIESGSERQRTLTYLESLMLVPGTARFVPRSQQQQQHMQAQAQSSLQSPQHATASNNNTSSDDVFFGVKMRVNLPQSKKEYQRYYSDEDAPNLRSDQHAEVLPWWSKQASRFPMLAEWVRVVLSIPASQAASERSFSVVSLIFSAKRTRMQSKIMNQYSFIRQNSSEIKALRPRRPKDRFLRDRTGGIHHVPNSTTNTTTPHSGLSSDSDMYDDDFEFTVEDLPSMYQGAPSNYTASQVDTTNLASDMGGDGDDDDESADEAFITDAFPWLSEVEESDLNDWVYEGHDKFGIDQNGDSIDEEENGAGDDDSDGGDNGVANDDNNGVEKDNGDRNEQGDGDGNSVTHVDKDTGNHDASPNDGNIVVPVTVSNDMRESI